MSKETQTKVKFSYNRSSRKVLIDVKHGTNVWFPGELATVLGFNQDTIIEKKTSSPYAADINGGFSSMYVYTDIVDAQFVGDVKVSLLRIVNIEGEYGNTVHTSFRNLQYVPVKVNSFETIEVNIKMAKTKTSHLSSGSQSQHFTLDRVDLSTLSKNARKTSCGC
ncbi:Hypothetical predicted protein [Paramuricea clavata]|uniref:Uncharacterized protein n=1 Tax=Paramuricea clavata TaxID=317549 RepID=A0A6S7LTU8_PARCT|nr:Hypothetical predicted protein [Paramuricea clavata]